jgi:hypothetical protein
MMTPTMIRSLALVMLLASGPALAGCGSADNGPAGAPDVVYENQIFVSTSVLAAAATNASTGRPSFSWPATGLKHVVAGIFRTHIDVESSQIVNTADLVWIWHSGIGRGREGNISFDDGASAIDADGHPTAGPVTLQHGTYYWAVWALDDEGTPVDSTIEYQLDVP